MTLFCVLSVYVKHEAVLRKLYSFTHPISDNMSHSREKCET